MEVIQSKKYGEITYMDLSFGFDLGDFEAVKDKRLLNINLAGGSLMDVGVYNIAISRFFKDDEIASVESKATYYETGVDLTTETIITYKDDVKVTAKTAINKQLKDDAVIIFENGEIAIPNFWRATSVIENGEIIEFPIKSDGFEYEIESFCTSLLKGNTQNSIMTHEASRRVMRTLDEIRSKINLVYPGE
jgi:predicted dehydrogenase